MREAVASAPGKVNLVLQSAAPTRDGYHPLFSVFEAVGMREYVHARTRKGPGIGVDALGYIPAPNGEGQPLFSGDFTAQLADIPPDTHLAVRAAKALMPLIAAKWGPSASGLHLTVHKVIPPAGGMAGGSADAAATLVAVNEMWGLGLNQQQLEAVGRTLGADVPACLHGNWAVGVGRGDHMTTLAPARERPAHWWALAFFREGLSTPAVFAEFDRQETARHCLPETAPLAASVYTGSGVARALENDLTGAALRLRPELADVGEEALRMGALTWMLSGSGPTIAALTDGREAAARVADHWARQAAEPGSALLGSAVTWGADVGAHVEQGLPTWVK